MTYYSVPMMLDVFRLTSETNEGTSANLLDHLRRKPGGFNFERGATHVRKAYQGYRNFKSLVAQCLKDGSSTALIQNAEVVRLVAPLCTGRVIQTFDFPKRTFALTPEIHSDLGPKFFFVENGVIKVFYLHARSNYRAGLSDLASLAMFYKQEILENDFFGQPADVEIVDVDRRNGAELVKRYSLADLEPFLKEDVQLTLKRFSTAFRIIDESKLAGEKRRPVRPEKDDGQHEFPL